MDRRSKRPTPKRWMSVLWACAVGAAVCGVGAPAPAQPNQPWFAVTAEKDEDRAGAQAVFPPVDRQLLLALSNARKLAAEGKYADAVRYLDAILDAPQDYFDYASESATTNLRSAPARVRPSLKAKAQALLGQMPSQGRELYELQFGVRARQMLTAAVASGDAAALAEVSRRFFHTRAGYEGTLLLGIHQLDHGSPLAAALTFQRVRDASPVAAEFEPGLSVLIAACWLRAGQPETARTALDGARQRNPRATVQIGGKDVALGAEVARLLGPPPVSRLPSPVPSSWLLFRGNAARSASTDSSGPLLSLVWRVPTTDQPFVESAIEEVQQSFREHDQWAIPSLHPLVVNGRVLMRTAGNLVAVDLITGKRCWETPAADPFDALLEPPADDATAVFMPVGGTTPDVGTAVRYRLWGDATFGTLSSDGQYVFAIEDLSLDYWGAPVIRSAFGPVRRSRPTDSKPYNRLAAYDLRTGKLAWHLGSSAEEFGLPQAGTFFLGSPLPLAGQLYVLGELKGEIRLLCIEAKTGNVAWTQQLAVVDQEREVPQDPLRRLAGVSPSCADGVLVCPTSNRSVVAVDLATRSLLWGYVYKTSDSSEANMPAGLFMPPSSGIDPEPGSRWANAPVILTEGRAVVTPADSAEVHCLNLTSGELVWRQPRQDGLFLACAYQGKVILAGRRSVWALKLADGSPAWDGRTVQLAGGSSPSGTGFLSGSHYYLPLSSAEVMAIDLDAGRAAHSYKSRRGVVPGNLVCCDGLVVSQRAGTVDLFHQLDALRKDVDRRLAARADDPEALAQRGEILWDEGKLKEAIGSLRRAMDLAPGPNTRGLLRDAMMEGLRTDFAAYRGQSEEVRRLLDNPRQEAAFLRLMATGFQAAGDFHAALDTYTRLMDLDSQGRDMETLDKSHTVRGDRWVRVQIQSLYEAAPEGLRAEIDKLARVRLAAAAADNDPEALRRFLDYYGGIPLADEARTLWVPKLRGQKRLLEAEMVLRRLERTGDRTRAGACLAELAAMLGEEGFAEDAAVCYARLGQDFSGVVCRDGKTGRQLLDALPPAARHPPPATPWPSGSASFQTSARGTYSPLSYVSSVVPQIDVASPFFADATLEVQVQQNPPLLLARDGWGKVRWQTQLGERTQPAVYASFGVAYLRTTIHDHLILLWTGTRMVAIDALAKGRGSTPAVFWPPAAGLSDARNPLRVARRDRQLNLARMAAGMDPLAPGNRPFLAANVPVMISEELVCYQRASELHGVDPMTGKDLWVRQDMRPDSVLFGDDQHVFVLPFDQPTATVLRAADGKLLDTRPVPQERLSTFGRNALVWRGGSLELWDPWEQRRAWPAIKFGPGARATVVDRETVAVFEHGGRFALVRIADGRKLIDAQLRPEPVFSDLHVFRSSDHTMLVVNGVERTGPSPVQVYGLPGMSYVQINRAHVYGFDGQGKRVWSDPVTVEDQYLPVNQPARLPVLAFACAVQPRNPNQPLEPTTVILCVDKRTGRTYGPESVSRFSYLRIAGDPEKKTVEFQMQQPVTLTFSDRPPPPLTPARTGEALWKAFLRGMGGESPVALPPAVKKPAPGEKKPAAPEGKR
jgi:outer membrane protein assembly factor BamB/tetratricopeptide (TPR) repeat protein